MFKSMIPFVSVCSLVLSSLSLCAQERKIEESLIYSDPTVARQDKWSGGIYLDFMSNSVGTTVYDTSNASHQASSNSSKVGFSGYYGKGDTSYLFSYHPAQTNMNVNNSGGTPDTINAKTDIYEFYVRKLDTTNTSWYVPYYLAGVGYVRNNWTVPTVVQHGVTEQQLTYLFAAELGAGMIIPQTDKYGFRLEAKAGIGNYHQTSNLFSQWNKSGIGGFIRPTATVYYNINERLNIQAGTQYDSMLRGPGVYLQVGTKF